MLKRKILFVVTNAGLGGAQKWVAEQIKLFSDEFDLYVSCSDNGWLINEISAHVQSILIDPKLKKKFSWTYLRHLNQFIDRHNIDMIVASSANAGVHARMSHLFTKKEIIYVSHGWSAVYNGTAFTRPFYSMVELLLSKLTSKVLVVSHNDQKIAEETIGIKKDKIVCIENAIYPLGEKLEINNTDRLKIVMVARFQSPKRQDLLIESLKLLENVDLYLVGDGPTMNQYKKDKIKNIHFLGETENVYETVKHCNIFALISEHEGLPMSVLEAMSIGLPLLLSNVGGCRMLVERNGVLVENTIEGIREGIRYLRNADLKQLSESSYSQYNETYNLEEHKEKYRELYGEK